MPYRQEAEANGVKMIEGPKNFGGKRLLGAPIAAIAPGCKTEVREAVFGGVAGR